MRHVGHGPAHGVVDDDLPGGVGQVIITADDMGHAHIVIIDHHGMHIGRRAIGTQDDEIIQVLASEYHLTLHVVANNDLAFQRRFDADHRLDVSRGIGGITVAPIAVVARRLSGARASSRICSNSCGEQ